MTKTKAKTKIKMIQIIVAPWTGNTGLLSYSTLGLDNKGQIWRYDAACSGWIAWNMEPATCAGHKR